MLSSHKNKHVENFFLSFVFKSQFANLRDFHIEYIKKINFSNHLTINYPTSMKQIIRLLFIFRSTQLSLASELNFPPKKKRRKEKKRKQRKGRGRKKVGRVVSNLAELFLFQKPRGLPGVEVDQNFLAHVRGDFKWKGRVVNFVIRRIPRALARCSFRFTGPNFSSLTR